MFPLVILAGVTGTVFMMLVMWFIHQRGWANADMIRAIGSLVTRRYENSVGPGILFQITAGCLFAVAYLFIMRNTGFSNPVQLVLIGLALGTFHGAAMIFILMAVAEKHPVAQFRKANVNVAFAHVAGHMAYGVGIGLIVAFFGPKIGGFPAI